MRRPTKWISLCLGKGGSCSQLGRDVVWIISKYLPIHVWHVGLGHPSCVLMRMQWSLIDMALERGLQVLLILHLCKIVSRKVNSELV